MPVLKELVRNGHQLILWTMRSHNRQDLTDPLQDAINWFKEHEIPLYGVNTNPTQENWTASPKAYAQLYIDDAALGCPLEFFLVYSERPYVYWVGIRSYLKEKGLI